MYYHIILYMYTRHTSVQRTVPTFPIPCANRLALIRRRNNNVDDNYFIGSLDFCFRLGHTQSVCVITLYIVLYLIE